MDREKQLERARKLLAMAQDSSSPTEAAIADRRLKVLMDEHHIAIEELNGADNDSSQRARTERSNRSAARRRRSGVTRNRSSSSGGVGGGVKHKQFRVRPGRLYAIVATFIVVVALGLWIAFTGIEETGIRLSGVLDTRPVEQTPRTVAPTLIASVERAFVSEGESIVLYINGSGVSKPPDTSSLASSFNVLGTQVARDKSTQEFQMRIVLQPRQSGVLFIPSFTVDGVQTEQIILEVRARR